MDSLAFFSIFAMKIRWLSRKKSLFPYDVFYIQAAFHHSIQKHINLKYNHL